MKLSWFNNLKIAIVEYLETFMEPHEDKTLDVKNSLHHVSRAQVSNRESGRGRVRRRQESIQNFRLL